MFPYYTCFEATISFPSKDKPRAAGQAPPMAWKRSFIWDGGGLGAPPKINMSMNITILNRRYIFSLWFFHFHVGFPGCIFFVGLHSWLAHAPRWIISAKYVCAVSTADTQYEMLWQR